MQLRGTQLFVMGVFICSDSPERRAVAVETTSEPLMPNSVSTIELHMCHRDFVGERDVRNTRAVRKLESTRGIAVKRGSVQSDFVIQRG